MSDDETQVIDEVVQEVEGEDPSPAEPSPVDANPATPPSEDQQPESHHDNSESSSESPSESEHVKEAAAKEEEPNLVEPEAESAAIESSPSHHEEPKPAAPSVFEGCGKELGTTVWRIEKFEARPVEASKYGQFYSGDSYVILHAKGTSPRLNYDIFFWLGEASSQDEQGTAALKAVELDNLLGGSPVQHRETQHHESAQFLSLWKQGVHYMDGGVASGFHKVDRDTFDKRLLHLKGKRTVRVTPVEISAASLNSGDVFILDEGLTLWQWNGKDSSRAEKTKGFEVSTHIKDNERGAKAKVNIVAEGEEPAEFWAAIGGQGPVKSAEAGGSDVEFEKSATRDIKLYKVSDESGKLEIKLVANSPLKRSMLDFRDCFILDIGNQIFVWIGKSSTGQEKAQAMLNASKFLIEMNHPNWTPITRIVQGAETPVFKAQFSVWTEENASKVDFTAVHRSQSRIARTKTQEKINVVDLLTQRTHSSADSAIAKLEKSERIDDGTGKLEVWRIEQFNRVPVPREQYGTFYSGDSYLISYQPLEGGGWIFFWLGHASSTDEKGAAAYMTKLLDDKLGGTATQVRLVQGKEPPQFLALFQGKFVVRLGGVESGFHHDASATSTEATPKVSMFHIKGESKNTVRAMQVQPSAASLNSSDAFVVTDGETDYLWFGKGCNPSERLYAANIAKVVAPGETSAHVVDEYAEPDEFWQLLGGKKEYATGESLTTNVHEPRLFHGSDATGVFQVEELFEWTQDDLMNDDVFLLDTHSIVYVWVGELSTKREKDMAMETAMNYVKQAATIDGRSADTPVIRVTPGAEPAMFTCWFLGWDSNKSGDAYERKLAALQPKSAAVGGHVIESPPAPVAASSYEHSQTESAPASAVPARATAGIYRSGSSSSFANKPAPAPAPAATAPVTGESYISQAGSNHYRSGSSSTAQKSATPSLSSVPIVAGGVMTYSASSGGRPYRSGGGAVDTKHSVTPINTLKTELTSAPAASSDVSSNTIIPYEQLKRVPPLPALPEGVDANKLEAYLSDEEFKAVLGTTKAEWVKLKGWQQKNKKQAAKLF